MPTEVPAGSYIIDMGNATPTIANTLRGYGAIYDLITNYRVPIYWVIDQQKAADGADFVYNGKTYRGGPFVIAGDYVDAAVLARITYWRGQGLTIDGPTTQILTLPVYDRLTYFPRTMMAKGNSGILTAYFTNAAIAASAYTVSTLDDATQVTCCYDIFMIPHADPTDKTHGRLLWFNLQCQGFIWAQCHAPNVLENVIATTAITTNPMAGQLNFLTNNGMSGATGTVGKTFSQINPGDPEMQMIGGFVGATNNGSGQSYWPLVGGWRSTTQIALYPTDAGAAPKGAEAPNAKLVYGPGFGNNANGRVEYIAGHDLTGGGTAQEQVNAQRAVFNFFLLAGISHRPVITRSIPAVMVPGGTYSVSASITGGSAPYTYLWSSNCGATFTAASSPSSSVTIPGSASELCKVTVEVTDSCGRRNFDAEGVHIASSVDLYMTKSADTTTFTPGTTATFRIVVGNAGPSTVTGATVADSLPSGVTMTGSWACTASDGGSCSAASGGAAGDTSFTLTVNLPANGTATITIPVIYSNDPRAF